MTFLKPMLPPRTVVANEENAFVYGWGAVHRNIHSVHRGCITKLENAQLGRERPISSSVAGIIVSHCRPGHGLAEENIRRAWCCDVFLCCRVVDLRIHLRRGPVAMESQ